MVMAAFNVVGGFAITDRMLRMFRVHKGSAGPAKNESGRSQS